VNTCNVLNYFSDMKFGTFPNMIDEIGIKKSQKNCGHLNQVFSLVVCK